LTLTQILYVTLPVGMTERANNQQPMVANLKIADGDEEDQVVTGMSAMKAAALNTTRKSVRMNKPTNKWADEQNQAKYARTTKGQVTKGLLSDELDDSNMKSDYHAPYNVGDIYSSSSAKEKPNNKVSYVSQAGVELPPKPSKKIMKKPKGAAPDPQKMGNDAEVYERTKHRRRNTSENNRDTAKNHTRENYQRDAAENHQRDVVENHQRHNYRGTQYQLALTSDQDNTSENNGFINDPEDDYDEPIENMDVQSYMLWMAGVTSFRQRKLLSNFIGLGAADLIFFR